MLRRHFKRRTYFAAATAPRPEYRWCYAEQVDQAAPLPDRSNGWRYLGPREGETYRRQAVFGAGFRLRLPFPRLSPGPGHRWFNSHPLGGDPDYLVDAQQDPSHSHEHPGRCTSRRGQIRHHVAYI